MSTFSVAVEIGPLDEDHFEWVEALVDTGASHSVFPGRLLRDLGIEPRETWPFRLADEHQREYEVGTARIRLHDRVEHTIVVFGDDGIQPLLGAVTLEEFRLAVDPVSHRLIPVPGLMMTLLLPKP
jgi:clan AA aspartic protease